MVQLNKLKLLTFSKEESEDRAKFVFPVANVGLLSLEELNLSFCSLIYGGLPEDIGCLSSLKELNLSGNNIEYLPRGIAQLGALQSLNLSDCDKLTQLPEIPKPLHTINADWSNDSICNWLFQNISSLQHDISVSDSLSLRVFMSCWSNIPSWFRHRGTGRSVSVNLPENWYVSDNFLGFAVCYFGKLIDIRAHLCSAMHFLFVLLGSYWLMDASNANGKTPNDYARFRLFSLEKRKKFGISLLYKDEHELQIGMRSSYELHLFSTRAALSHSSKKQHSQHKLGL